MNDKEVVALEAICRKARPPVLHLHCIYCGAQLMQALADCGPTSLGAKFIDAHEVTCGPKAVGGMFTIPDGDGR